MLIIESAIPDYLMLPLWIHSAGLSQPGVDLLGDLHHSAEQYPEFLEPLAEYLGPLVGYLGPLAEFLGALAEYLGPLAEYLGQQVAGRRSRMIINKHYKLMLL